MKRLLVLGGIIMFSLFAVPVSAADWQAAERQCMASCPQFPRFSGIETDEEYNRRMQLQAEYDQCFARCAEASAATAPHSFVPISREAADYFKRNEKDNQ